METKILKPTEKNLNLAAEMIKAGELVAFPTETVYGLGADGLNKKAREKIYFVKGRPSEKPLTLHVANLEQAEKVAKISLTAEKLFKKFCPGPLTIILEKNEKIPDFVTNGKKNIGIRFPDNEIALKLIKISETPIAAPSANISGENPPKNAEEVFKNLNGKISVILNGGECKFGISSTIIDLSQGTPKILRVGAISPKMIEEVLNFKNL